MTAPAPLPSPLPGHAVASAPVGTVVRLTGSMRSVVAIKIRMATLSSGGQWNTSDGPVFDFAIAIAKPVLFVPAAEGETP